MFCSSVLYINSCLLVNVFHGRIESHKKKCCELDTEANSSDLFLFKILSLTISSV